MKTHLLFWLAIAFLLFPTVHSAQSGPGDTIVVNTFSFGSAQDAWFVFPSDTVRLEKILMKYTLKCNPAQSPACGQWDYLTNTVLHKKTGLIDSALVNQPIYTVNGTSPDSILFYPLPSYRYYPSWQYYVVQTATTSLNTYTSGTGANLDPSPFTTTSPVSRTLYLWRAAELTAAGMAAGNITGLRLFIQSLGGSMQNLRIRMQNTALDSLTQATLPNSGFTSAYDLNTQFNSSGWNSIQLTNSFNWNGTSNLLIEITYDNILLSQNNSVLASSTPYHSGLFNAGADRVAAFLSGARVEVPLNNALTALDSAVTITFWAYGGLGQPADGSAFEAVDSLGNRILNCHLPWSDSNIYWDAGGDNLGQYDRISKAAVTSEIKGVWNYWAMTKNVGSGSMKIYKNGSLWFSGVSKTKRMKNIRSFYIGQMHGGNSYTGNLDEFALFSKELSQATIQTYMNKKIDAQHPNFANLVLHYSFDDGNYSTFSDAAPGNHPAANLVNGVDNPLKSSQDLTTNFTQTTLRPNVVFEQGVYASYIDSTLVIDSVAKAPIQIVYYTDSLVNPGSITSTTLAWPAAYQYSFTAQGAIYDSLLITPITKSFMAYYNWYRKFPQVIDYELSRYITPYGIGLSLGNGFTWTYDLSDYRTLLADSVHLSAGNWQELLDVKFLLVRGTPPRDLLGVKNLWTGDFDYGASTSIETKLVPLTVTIPANAFNSRWKSRVTGHGMDTPQNCAEFCAKTHYYKVNGALQFSKLVWRDDCSKNPVPAQGGTWVYSRSNWCPGAEVRTYDFELSPSVVPGSTVSLDHDVDAYNNTGGWDYFRIHDQLITYGAPNFQLDAAVEDILSPTTDQMWGHYNPICANPVIKIKNTGATPLTSLAIAYGLQGAPASVYNWTGNLAFMDVETVTLSTFAWSVGASEFTVSVSDPNGGSDQYQYNNTRSAGFVYPTSMPSQFVILLKTNSSPGDNQYVLNDAQGNPVFSKTNLSANTLYSDTMNLADGCYEFRLTDAGEDGLTWWADPGQGSGYLKFVGVSPAGILKNFNSDFGAEVYQQFTVGFQNDVGIKNYVFTKNALLAVYPNPASHSVMIDIDLPERRDATVEITNVLGEKVYSKTVKDQTAESVELNVTSYKKGVYFIVLRSENEILSKKLVIE